MAARGAVRYGTVSSATGGKKRVFPRDGMGKCSRLFTAGWEWDGKVGSHFVEGMEREYTISWDGTGRETMPRRESVGKCAGNIFGESVGNIVGNAVVLPRIICLDHLHNVQTHARRVFGVANTGPSHLFGPPSNGCAGFGGFAWFGSA